MSDDLTPEVEKAQDDACVLFARGAINRAEARRRLIATGLDAGVVDEGLDEQEAAMVKFKADR